MNTDVVFLKDKTGGETIVVFPGIAGTSGRSETMLYYAHTGQHGSADFAYCNDCNEVTDPEEYADLEAELVSVGYRVRVVPKDTMGDEHYADERCRQLQP